MTKNIYSTLSRILLTGALMAIAYGYPNKVVAQYYGQSGNGPVIVIDKKIGFSGDKNYYDNISSNTKVFTEGQEISFKIRIENRGDQTLNNLVVRDVLPSYLSLLMYPGALNKETNSIEVKVDSLTPGESKEFMIIARISNSPVKGNASNLELTNQACVSNNQVSDCDKAKYFISYLTVPVTGANDLMVKTLSIVAACLTAVVLRKKARGY